MFILRRMFVPLLCGGVAFALGCGSGGPPPEKQATIQGKVTLDGNPVPVDTQVLFVNTDAGASGNALTDSNGSYRITPLAKDRGLPAGRYQVSVGVKQREMSPDEYQAFMRSGKRPPVPPAVLPAKYGNTSTSGLVFEVNAGDQTIDIPLKK